jgi:hypothetical protein
MYSYDGAMTNGWVVLLLCVLLVVALTAASARLWGQRAAMITAAATTSVIVLVALLGFPAPGPLRRYSLSELRALRDDLDQLEAVEYPVRDPCIEQITINGARIDYLRGRVELQSEGVAFEREDFEAELDRILDEQGHERRAVRLTESEFNDLSCQVPD